MNNAIKEEVKEIKGILGRIKRRDLKGNTGQAIKNSTYQITTTIVSKVGSLLFTIILARILLPELYGLYGLTLSAILLFTIFSDLGVGAAITTFMSKKLAGKNISSAKGYYLYFRKIKIILFLITAISLAILSYPLAVYYYKKPIFLALLIGILYLLANLSIGFFIQIFHAKNNFKIPLIKEIIIQSLRLIIVPISIILFAKKLSVSATISLIILTLSLTYFIASTFLFFKLNYFKDIKPKQLTKKEKSTIWKFVIPLSAIALSGTFFGNIDMFMLGGFIEDSTFIGYYFAAFGLIGSAAAILSFSSISLLPIFSKLKGDRLEQGFKKTIRLTLLISISAAIFTFVFAKIIIKIPGPSFSPAVHILEIFSLILISAPLIALYTTYYISQKYTKKFAIILFASTLLNIALNYILITALLPYGMMQATYGACIATIISRYLNLAGLIIFKKKR
ncbi:MAG: oligosaccharide flippase family protein [Nanoarchaeota archaeon]|nr:oligosaccharide flippase family protein [Nanoarchaeota archaeon]